MYNSGTWIGRITSELELRHMNNEKNTPFTFFSIACNRPKRKDRDEVTDFIPVKAIGKLAETMTTYSGKGRLICVNGPLHVEPYESNGERKKNFYILADRIVFLDRGKDSTQSRQQGDWTGGVPEDEYNF